MSKNQKSIIFNTYGFKGKYCTLCNSVWEVVASQGAAGIEVKHPDFPTYGLEREDCSSCKQVSPETNIPDTLAQKAAEKHKKLFIKYVKKQSK